MFRTRTGDRAADRPVLRRHDARALGLHAADPTDRPADRLVPQLRAPAGPHAASDPAAVTDFSVHPTMVKWAHVQRERERDRVLREHTGEMRAFRRTFAPEPGLSRLAAGGARLLIVLDPRGL